LPFQVREEFVEKYKDKSDAQLIGHFGLGFYSASWYPQRWRSFQSLSGMMQKPLDGNVTEVLNM
jgi:hypothetical protein